MRLKKTDHRIYECENKIPIVLFGCGGIGIAQLEYKNADVSGIGFHLIDKIPIGDFVEGTAGKKDHEIKVFFKILSTSPKSFQVLIDALEGAKTSLELKLKKGVEDDN